MVGIKWIAILQIACNFFGRAHNQIQTKASIEQQAFNAPSRLTIALSAVLHNQQIQITRFIGVAARLGAKQDNKLWVDSCNNSVRDCIDHFWCNRRNR